VVFFFILLFIVNVLRFGDKTWQIAMEVLVLALERLI